MDTPVLIGLVLFIVVGFFAFQWWTHTQGVAQRGSKKVVLEPAPPATQQPTLAAAIPEKHTQEQKYPVVAGQSEQDLRAKEPVQEARPANPKIPVDHMNTMSPTPVEENLRHPEQLFHQPSAAVQEIPASDVAAGRAAIAATPGAGNVQQFTPEMAQNGGALIGNSVFAFDGMEPTGFAAF
jgi:hypothetical protein